MRVGLTERPVIDRITWSIISFATHNCPTGIRAETSRRAIVAVVMDGLVFQTIRSSGGTLRRARRRSRQVAGAAAADFKGWGAKYQSNAPMGGS